jgi:glycosyltransferase involved in cell wall biosynthesis
MAPRLSIGLPVYNGTNYLRESLDALLAQSFGDFELIISDNASTDATEDICRAYQADDSRIRYYRQRRNIGLVPNHHFVVNQATGSLFKLASHDDVYAPTLLAECVAALDAMPEAVLAHSWTAYIDASGAITTRFKYSAGTDSPRAPDRFRGLLFSPDGDDDGGVVRTDVLRRAGLWGSYHHADRTFTAALTLHGPFCHVPDWLYYRRDHPERAERAYVTVRSRCVNMDPRRASRLWHPVVRLYGEYIWGYMSAIRQAPLSAADRRECYRHLLAWAASRAVPNRSTS